MALKTRATTLNDLAKLWEMHQLHFPELDFPDFGRMLNSFVIEDEKGIIMAGGIQPTAEAFLLTDLDASRIKVGKALVLAQRISEYTCRQFNIRELTAFVDDSNYAKHLIQHGFEDRKQIVLSMRIKDG